MNLLKTITRIFCFVFLANQATAQCSVTADAGTDQTLCADQFSTTLNGSFTDDALDFFWTPATGLDDPTILNPTATVSANITYTLNVQAADNTNLFTNGDFESGNNTFTSGYSYVDPGSPFGLISPGSYTIITSPELVINNAPPCDDHTFGDGSGQQMVVNGDGSVGANIWCQTVAVTAGTEYNVSAWMTNYNPLSDPSVQFSVDGSLIGNPFSTNTPCLWQNFGASFTATTSTSVEICLTNQFGGNGLLFNDFGLDDFSLTAICTSTDEMSITVLDPQVSIENVQAIDCNNPNPCFLLNAAPNNISGTLSYEWTASNGGTISAGENTATPEICTAGDYSVTLTETLNGVSCETTTTVSIADNQQTPPVPILSGIFSICQNDIGTYSIESVSGFTNITWSPPPGATIISGQGTTAVDIEFSGAISGELCVTVENQCSYSTATCMFVELLGDPPLPEISGPQEVCSSDEAVVYTLDNLDINSWVEEWQLPGDAILLSGQGSESILVDWSASSGGEVCVQVTNLCGQSENCVSVTVLPASDTLFVTESTCDLNEVGEELLSFTDVNGCDSLVVITTFFSESDTTEFFSTSCDIGEVGVAEVLLENILGCDSLVITTTTFSESDTTELFFTSCDVDEVGVAEVLLENILGCDSLVITTTAFLESDTTELFTTSCDIGEVGISEELLEN
ncbi:MAG: hypothetical protein AB8F74_22300, partial [Saprospiraceae bacterium]